MLSCNMIYWTAWTFHYENICMNAVLENACSARSYPQFHLAHFFLNCWGSRAYSTTSNQHLEFSKIPTNDLNFQNIYFHNFQKCSQPK